MGCHPEPLDCTEDKLHEGTRGETCPEFIERFFVSLRMTRLSDHIVKGRNVVYFDLAFSSHYHRLTAIREQTDTRFRMKRLSLIGRLLRDGEESWVSEKRKVFV